LTPRVNLAPSLEITGKQGLDVQIGGTYRFSGAGRSVGEYIAIGRKF
jgi:hypothetical protein